MCQLTAIKSYDSTILKALTCNQLLVNTEETHKDGTGISYFNKDGSGYIMRNVKAPTQNPDFWKEFIEDIKTAKFPLLAHVRRASVKTGEIRLDFVHPFYDEDTKITFAHNGTLKFIDHERQNKIEEEFPDMIDSQIFFSVFLEKFNASTKRKDEEKIVEALNESMKLFWGKFAFLLEKGKTIYVVRGRTAQLHQALITNKESGKESIVINTEKEPLVKNLVYTLNTLRASGKNFTIKISSLKEETIYKLSGTELIEIGEIKQNDRPSYKGKSGTTDEILADHYAQKTVKTGKRTSLHEASVKLIISSWKELGLTPVEFDYLILSTMGTPLSEIVISDVRDFRAYYFPTLIDLIREDKDYALKQELWNNLCTKTRGVSRMSIYEMYGLHFPYFLNEVKDLENAYKESLIKEKKS